MCSRKNKMDNCKIIPYSISIVVCLLLMCPKYCDPLDIEGDGACQDCLKPPDDVPIECRLVNVKHEECQCINLNGKNVISIPVPVEEDKSGEISCQSPSPITLTFVGYQLNDYTNISFVREAKDFSDNSTYRFSVSLSLVFVKAPKWIVISLSSEPQKSFRIFLFRPGSSIFATNLKPNPDPQQGSVITLDNVQRNLVIPCISNNPSVALILEAPSALTYENIPYEKTEGFVISGGNRLGRYVCKPRPTDREKYENETVWFDVQPTPVNLFEPQTKDVYLFKNSELRITCMSMNAITLTGTFKGENITSEAFTLPDSIFPHGLIYYKNPVQIGDSGVIHCKDQGSGAEIMSWKIETLDIFKNPVLQLETLANYEVTCQSSLKPAQKMELKMVFCQGEVECKLNEFCFDDKEANSSSCLNSLQGALCGFHNASFETFCLHIPHNDSASFHSQGMLRCSVGPHSFQANFLIGFDKKLYLNWREAPVPALIDIWVPDKRLKSLGSYNFGCRTSKFYSDGEIQWDIKLAGDNETKLSAPAAKELHLANATEQDYRLYTVRESQLTLTYVPGEYNLICMVPKWNDMGWASNQKRISIIAGDENEQSFNTSIIIVIVSSSLIVTAMLGLVFYIMWRLKKAKDAMRSLTDREVQEFMDGIQEDIPIDSAQEAHEIIDYLPYDRRFEIPREKLIIDNSIELGKGAFGTVLKGRVEGLAGTVAVKTISNDCEVNRFKAFLSELKIMIYIGQHPNIVTLIGASTEQIKEKTLFIIAEFCENGCLESYLRTFKRCFFNQIVHYELLPEHTFYGTLPKTSTRSDIIDGSITTMNLLKWSLQIASGMEYISRKKVIHADLATRNILLDINGTAKITDFGLSRQLYNYTEYVKKQQEPLPWRWMAIESLQQLRFSTESDIWGFGILLWEIFSLGDVPYPGIVWGMHFVHELKNGLRMDKPPFCTDEIYNLMKDCWEESPDQRPSFSAIVQYFKSLLESEPLTSTSLSPIAGNYVDLEPANEDLTAEDQVEDDSQVASLISGYSAMM